ncbi:MAG: DUF1080 domain-containing protein [Pirellulaceae bacterium]|jgi:hypothetical protein|nr:DUF1080 domain-containing protein [Pirellulaceae bacterium]
MPIRRVGPCTLVVLLIGCEFTAAPSVHERPAPGAAAAPRVVANSGPDREAVRDDPPRLSDELLAEGWIQLFDGQTLFGWQHHQRADWRVEDGAIVVSSGEKGLLTTTAEFASYVLRADFRADPGTNSGIFLSTSQDPVDVLTDCYELNIAGADNPFPTGSLVQRQAVAADLHRADWQSYEVQVSGGHVVVHLDGQLVLDYLDPQPLLRGHIGLQFNTGRVAFRNLVLRPLGLEPLFNGRDLSGWKSYPEMTSRFTVTPEGWLNVQDGRGQLETERLFGDFALQLECVSHAAGLNSGIFFRCIPGEQMNGYEVQIHNGFHDGDRTRPVDCGTGGIFRRQDARRVVSNDLEWFYQTIVAHGPHVAVWVNGYQVTDWTDTRAPDPNPRKGLRVEPGTIMIQGHDPTTNLSFRHLRAAPWPPGR